MPSSDDGMPCEACVSIRLEIEWEPTVANIVWKSPTNIDPNEVVESTEEKFPD
jgi:hypothetical protein